MYLKQQRNYWFRRLSNEITALSRQSIITKSENVIYPPPATPITGTGSRRIYFGCKYSLIYSIKYFTILNNIQYEISFFVKKNSIKCPWSVGKTIIY